MNCPRCGNPQAESQAGGGGRCRYCGESLPGRTASQEFRYRQVSIKDGMPLTDEALRRLNASIGAARAQAVRVLSVIHGYGASGKGGVIRDECRKYLEILRDKGQIADFVRGEDLGKRRSQGKNLLQRFPQLDSYRDCQVANPGITVVVL